METSTILWIIGGLSGWGLFFLKVYIPRMFQKKDKEREDLLKLKMILFKYAPIVKDYLYTSWSLLNKTGDISRKDLDDAVGKMEKLGIELIEIKPHIRKKYRDRLEKLLRNTTLLHAYSTDEGKGMTAKELADEITKIYSVCYDFINDIDKDTAI